MPRFKAIEMKKSDFLNCSDLMSMFCTNRKQTVDNQSLNWFTFRRIDYEKGHPLQLFFETYSDIAEKYDEKIEIKTDQTKIISVSKRGFNSDDFIQMEMTPLYPDGRAISTEKKIGFIRIA